MKSLVGQLRGVAGCSDNGRMSLEPSKGHAGHRYKTKAEKGRRRWRWRVQTGEPERRPQRAPGCRGRDAGRPLGTSLGLGLVLLATIGKSVFFMHPYSLSFQL